MSDKVDRSAVFTADGFYPTRDLVRIDEDGLRAALRGTLSSFKVPGGSFSSTPRTSRELRPER